MAYFDSRLRRVILSTPWWVFVGLLLAPPLHADLRGHSVTLPANVDPSKCLECHSDKATGKHVHTAISREAD